MSAWFQCESSADFRGVNQDGFCSRNSAVGFKGGFGNAFVGIWDTPYKRARVGQTGARDTGVYGIGHLMDGGSTSTTDGGSAGIHSRRQRNSINYDTPSFGGFTGMVSISSTNASTAITTNSAVAKARTTSLAGVYRSGPLAIGLGYNENSKAYAAGTDEDAWHISAAYTFGNGLKLGGSYVSMDADTTAVANAEVDAWHIGLEWKISGPHNVHFAYTDVGDMKGTAGAAMGTRPVVNAAGSTGADMWQIRYQHDLSKRTWAGVGYVQLKNDSNANYNLGGLSQRREGSKNTAFVFNVNHRF
jgi:predicted porin